ncbi:PP2C family protein-serine/threonine phosphatase [Streptomyces reniochalinae]|uniref:Serine/threonine-protein phosphatase n=1 Tax=Streptomyces reniochalinae TaxID=2250578 RepID=A0A367F468_9ACTN|nr:PP2C family protein-serine/threonine phosphatase [Streptomyces reniochalinae]RCG25168.1 serine/threonine-protein phosphatase [Streptomyces reniochalinae]
MDVSSDRATEDALAELHRLALRTVARARHRARARIAAERTGGRSGREEGPPSPFVSDGAGQAPPSDVAVLPGLPSWVPAVLGVLRGSSTVLRPDIAPDGTVCDFTVVGANHFELSGVERGSFDFLGKRLSETRPGVRTSGLYDVYRAALEKGTPVSSGTVDYVDVVDGVLQRARLRGTVTVLPRLGLLLTNWEPAGEARLSHRVQEGGRMGWAEWDLISGRTRWSHGLRELLGLRAPPPEGVTLEDVHAAEGAARTVASARDVAADLFTVGRKVDPADLPGFVADMRALLRGVGVPDRELTVRVEGSRRRIRWVGHAQPEGAEVPESLLFAARNITGQEEQLRQALVEAERLRQEAATERRVSETFRKALVPPLEALTPPWISVSSAYVPSDSGVGGDWYKCRELPDGRVLLAMGDASGHGVQAASRAVQQRSALAGLAYTGGDAAQLLWALGEVVYNDYYGNLDTTATCVVGHLFPEARAFRWASAGHPAPILVRNGEPRLLEGEHGMMLGVLADADYTTNTAQLHPGDLLLLYTDGVVERRGSDLETGSAALLEAVRRWMAQGRLTETASERMVAQLLGPEAEDDATILAIQVS